MMSWRRWVEMLKRPVDLSGGYSTGISSFARSGKPASGGEVSPRRALLTGSESFHRVDSVRSTLGLLSVGTVIVGDRNGLDDVIVEAALAEGMTVERFIYLRTMSHQGVLLDMIKKCGPDLMVQFRNVGDSSMEWVAWTVGQKAQLPVLTVLGGQRLKGVPWR